MEIRNFQHLVHVVMIGFLFSSAFGSSSDVPQDRISPIESSHETNRPEFITEPKDSLILPNSRTRLRCTARFVSKLKFNCTGGVVPTEMYLQQNQFNETKLKVDISKIKDLPEVSCVCQATGYSGQILWSKAATVKRSYLGENVVVSPSAPRVAKNSQVSLKCYPPIGLPRPTVSWLKDDSPLVTHQDGRVEFINQDNFSQVVIREAWTSDSGYYSCQVSNPVGLRSAKVKLNVYVDGGWSAWKEFSPCSAEECGNGTRTMKRFCTNPPPQNDGQICKGPSFKEVVCQGICPDVEIICPSHITAYVNRSDVNKKVTENWDQPQVINKKNGTEFTVQVTPPWAVPPVELYSKDAVYIITYTVRREDGKTASCSFNLTVRNDSGSIGEKSTEEPSWTNEPSPSKDGKLSIVIIGVTVGGISLLVVIIAFVSKSRQMYNIRRYTHERGLELGTGSFKVATLDSTSPLITHSSSYFESAPVVRREKLRAVSPTFDEEFDFMLLPLKEPPRYEHVVQAEFVKPAAETTEAETGNGKTKDRARRYERTNSSISNKSTASEISRMMWNISNLPENVNPKMMAWGLVDHNGGRFTIGDTGVSLIVPPQAIPEGHTEGIYIAILDQEKEHPQITAKESLLSPVVKCGPNGLKFNRPVILSLPHCALLEEGTWNLKVQYNEAESGTPADWEQLIDINKQDGSDPYLALLEPNTVHLMVDHFTLFAVTGESAPNEQAKIKVKIVAYVTPPAQDDGDCVVRVYCVGDLPVHLQNLHSQETERLGGITREAPQLFHFNDDGGDLLVKLTDHHPAWINTAADQKKIRFKHIWEGIESMPSRSFVFSLVDKSVPQFRATFEVTQDCQDGDETEVSVSTSIKQTSKARDHNKSESSKKATKQACNCGGSSSLSKASSEPCLEDNTTAVLHAGSLVNHWHSTSQVNILLGAGPASPTLSPHQLKNTSSGYFSFGFEPSPSMDSLSSRIRNELILILDPPHPKSDWKSLADSLGFEMKHIRWLANRNPPASPTDILLTVLEGRKYPLNRLAEKLRDIGRDDAASLVDAQLLLRETEV